MFAAAASVVVCVASSSVVAASVVFSSATKMSSCSPPTSEASTGTQLIASSSSAMVPPCRATFTTTATRVSSWMLTWNTEIVIFKKIFLEHGKYCLENWKIFVGIKENRTFVEKS